MTASNEGDAMAGIQDEIEQLKFATFDALSESQEALVLLREKCVGSTDLLLSDLGRGAVAVAEVAELIHDFLIFEQRVVDLFSIDVTQVVVDCDSLARVESDMQILLASFDEKMEAMDIGGVVELMQKSVPAMLLRFETVLPVLRDLVYDFINQ